MSYNYNYDYSPFEEIVYLRQQLREVQDKLEEHNRNHRLLDDKLQIICEELSRDYSDLPGVKKLSDLDRLEKLQIQRQAAEDFPNLKKKSSKAQGILNMIRRGNPPHNS